MPQYRVAKPFSIDPFTFNVGDPVTEAELYPFASELLANGSVVEQGAAKSPAPKDEEEDEK